jgi:hypothetical protein
LTPSSAFFNSGSTIANSAFTLSKMILISLAFLLTMSTSLFTNTSFSLATLLSTYKTSNNFFTFSVATSISGCNLARFIYRSAI